MCHVIILDAFVFKMVATDCDHLGFCRFWGIIIINHENLLLFMLGNYAL